MSNGTGVVGRLVVFVCDTAVAGENERYAAIQGSAAVPALLLPLFRGQ